VKHNLKNILFVLGMLASVHTQCVMGMSYDFDEFELDFSADGNLELMDQCVKICNEHSGKIVTIVGTGILFSVMRYLDPGFLTERGRLCDAAVGATCDAMRQTVATGTAWSKEMLMELCAQFDVILAEGGACEGLCGHADLVARHYRPCKFFRKVCAAIQKIPDGSMFSFD
jgi:hypothetical protein